MSTWRKRQAAASRCAWCAITATARSPPSDSCWRLRERAAVARCPRARASRDPGLLGWVRPPECALALAAGPDDAATPAYVEQAFRRYLDCGILAHGFARAFCAECGHDFLVAFSCKARGVCPSCNTRRMVETAAHLTDHVLPPLPVRQLLAAKRNPKHAKRWSCPYRSGCAIFCTTMRPCKAWSRASCCAPSSAACARTVLAAAPRPAWARWSSATASVRR